MSRLAADGWLERTRIGRNSFYHLTEKGRATFRQATEHIYAAQRPALERPLRAAPARQHPRARGRARRACDRRVRRRRAGSLGRARRHGRPARRRRGRPSPRRRLRSGHGAQAGAALLAAGEDGRPPTAVFSPRSSPWRRRSTPGARSRSSMRSWRAFCWFTSTGASSCAIPSCRPSCCPRAGPERRRGSCAPGSITASCPLPSAGSTTTARTRAASCRRPAPSCARASGPRHLASS